MWACLRESAAAIRAHWRAMPRLLRRWAKRNGLIPLTDDEIISHYFGSGPRFLFEARDDDIKRVSQMIRAGTVEPLTAFPWHQRAAEEIGADLSVFAAEMERRG